MTEQYLKVRRQTENICKLLRPEDSTIQPVIDVSPPKWHLAHSTWFFETFVLKPYKANYKEFHPDYGFLFNSYYETIGEKVPRALRGTISRPGLLEVLEYRKYVDEQILEFLKVPVKDKLIASTIELGLQHEQQHQELLYSDIKYILGHNPIFPVYDPDSRLESNNLTTDDSFLEITEGIYSIGYAGSEFCFDNELGRHKVFLHHFKIRKSLVRNEEYLEFIEDGGYDKFNLWLADGWDWVKQNKIKNPMYWHLKEGKWKIFTLHGLIDLPVKNTLCHVSFYEADAFARWKGNRLPTEFEWEAASPQFDYGIRWEWTNSAYLPYPYFKKADGAIGEYNGKFMINQMILRGGSVASPAGHLRPSYRNFFPPDKQWQFSGIRLTQ